MILLPDNLENVELNKDEKIFVNSIKNKLEHDVIGLVSINPTGLKGNEMIALIKSNGLVLIKVYNLDTVQAFIYLKDTLFRTNYKKSEEILKRKLLGHKFLCTDENTLKFPVNMVFYFPLIERCKIDENDEFVRKNCWFKEEKQNMGEFISELLNKAMEDSFVHYTRNMQLTSKEKDIIVQRLAPEYSIPRMAIIEESINPSGKKNSDYYIKESDRLIDVMLLDKEQINIINNIQKGEQLILACAGSGKSVLLVSKCFKIASMQPDKRFLLTCYNVNLKNYYQWQIDVAGFREKNVKCSTFSALCKEFLVKYGISHDASNHDEIFMKANKALRDGIIKERYFGIFIDEVQIFNSEWYKFCYNLLENRNSDDHIFVICGDISQNMNNCIKQGQAPWQGDPELPKFRGTNKSLRIEKNYRNTVQINDFVNFFINYSNKCFEKYNINVKNKDELFLRGQAFRQGNMPNIIGVEEKSNKGEAKAVVGAIMKLHEEQDIPYTDIAVVLYNTKYRYIKNWQNKYYSPLINIKELLDDRYIPYSLFMDSSQGIRQHYATRDGVTLVTCQGVLGLDFKAVILCGLKSMGEHYNSKKEELLQNLGDSGILIKEEFFTNINTLYTACTRAKEELIIITPEEAKDSIYTKLLGKALISLTSRRGHYEELEEERDN